MNEYERPLLLADILVKSTANGGTMPTIVSATSGQGYEVPYAPEEIRGRDFINTMHVFHNNNNVVTGQSPKVGELTFRVTGVKYGTVKDILDDTPLTVISLDEYIVRGMPESISIEEEGSADIE